ncbi:MAG: protein-glutamate O-methyltransferase CheR [Gammaproteobacteria bacterium]|nr:protein-glutamate O-methyltransferase CheR [Gammaproteobacteria bacterium]
MDHSISAQEYHAFREFLESVCGIALGENKHYLVSSRLNRLMGESGIRSIGDLVEQLKRNSRPGLRERVVDAMTTNETLWFRDNAPFDILKHHILPDLSGKRMRPVRIWSAACSSGQEPYSISMMVQEYLGSKPGGLAAGVQIIATDISPTMIKEAKAGLYDSMALARGLSDERRKRFFTQKGAQWEAKDEIRKRITFSELNLIKKDYHGMGKFDVIFCRNVLIYFSGDVKRNIIANFSKVMEPGGYLFLGASESISGYSDVFEMVRCHGGIVYRLIEK